MSLVIGGATTASSSGSITIGPNSSTANGYFQQQSYGSILNNQPYTITAAPSYNYVTINNSKYATFSLPRAKIPEAVYVNGRRITLGILGSDVEAAYTGDTLIFSPDTLTAIVVNNKITVILEYNNTIYHYNIAHNFNIVEFEEGTTKVKATLLSQIKRGRKCLNQET